LVCISWRLSRSQRRTSKIPPISLCVCVCIPLSLLFNGSVFPRQRIHERKNCWTCRFLCGPCRITGRSVGLAVYPVNTFPLQRTVVGGVVFYVIRAVSKESRLLALLRTFCLSLKLIYFRFSTVNNIY
jgi:hypothetical protein